MRALIFHGPGDVRLEDVPRPEPGPGDVLVQVEVALTDGTDAKAYHRGHPVLLGPPPSPFGHEFCGVDTATGRRVVAANSAPCGECAPCRRGDETLCERLFPLLNGAYAEFLLVPERIARRNLLPVPRGLSPEVAALVEPLACCLHGVARADVQSGDTVAILGAGPIGLMLCACVADAGGRPVVVGGRPERRELAALFGGTAGSGEGADVVIEAAGTEQAWQDALGLVRPGGTVLFFGGLPRESTPAVDSYRLHYEELTLRGAFHHTPSTVRAALAFLASGAYPWERLITHQVGLERRCGAAGRPAARLPEGRSRSRLGRRRREASRARCLSELTVPGDERQLTSGLDGRCQVNCVERSQAIRLGDTGGQGDEWRVCVHRLDLLPAIVEKCPRGSGEATPHATSYHRPPFHVARGRAENLLASLPDLQHGR